MVDRTGTARDHVENAKTNEREEHWTGDYIFENDWQSFRTKKTRPLEFVSIFHEYMHRRRKIIVNIVDVLVNDTMMILDVIVGAES